MIVEPKSVLTELQTHSELYDVDEMLILAKDCNHEEAQAFLLEKNNKYLEAFEVRFHNKHFLFYF